MFASVAFRVGWCLDAYGPKVVVSRRSSEGRILIFAPVRASCCGPHDRLLLADCFVAALYPNGRFEKLGAKA